MVSIDNGCVVSHFKLILFMLICFGQTKLIRNQEITHGIDDSDIVRVNKCCEKFEVLSDLICMYANETETFKPVFTSYSGVANIQVQYKFVIGLPACGSMQSWPIYYYPKSSDKLDILPDGKLRHYTNYNEDDLDDDDDEDEEKRKRLFYDYPQGQYCVDKAVSIEETHGRVMFARICLPEKEIKWTDTDFLFRKILNPLFHGISLIILLIISIVYFILPTLRDLVGNIITTITVCLMVGQAADLVRIFTEFSSHVSFIVADIILCISLLGAFFWLNSLGYYIWKTFRSRNVFLRVTDGRKYCYYSVYAWGATSVMAIMAIFAHFFLDIDTYKKKDVIGEQETIGWLGIAVFFTPIAFTIIIDIFFYVTTLQSINRRNVYGRIQHKLKANFIMYSLLALVMVITWIFQILSWLDLDGIFYAHIIVNAIQSPLILYICILRQKHVTFLLKKSCCYNEPPSTNDWGDEMNYINTNDY